jgi:uncharacterized protein (DUF486 family)
MLERATASGGLHDAPMRPVHLSLPTFPAFPMWLATLFLLTISNVFMTFAWYGHLKFKNVALWTAILASWAIAFVEYCFQVPANRIGHNAGVSAAQLKTFQEVITLAVFCAFSVLYLKEPLKWNYVAGFVLIAFGALFVFAPWQRM